MNKFHRFASIFMLGSLLFLALTIIGIKKFVQSPDNSPKLTETNFNFSKIKRIQKKKDVSKVKKQRQKMKRRMKALKPSLNAQFKGPSFGMDMQSLTEMNLDDDLLASDEDVIMDENSVDSKPKVLSRSAIEFPEKAIKNNILKGMVEVRMLIDKNGNVNRTEVLDANPKGYFEEVTIAMVQDWKFEPASYRGKSVAIWAKQVVRFGE